MVWQMIGVCAAGVLVAQPLVALSALAMDLTPHRAVYDVSLSNASSGANIADARGRLVFDLSGAACEGYVVNSRFVTRITNREGQVSVTDLRSATFETVDPARFDFLNTTISGDNTRTEVKGTAEALSTGTIVERMLPEEGTLNLKRAVFPAAHTKLILESARAGDRVLEVPVFDAGDEADRVYDTTTIISTARAGLPGASDTERSILDSTDTLGEQIAWRVVISYFEDASTGEQTPAYELSFDLLENGVAYNVRFTYAAFALDGKLSELSLSPQPDC